MAFLIIVQPEVINYVYQLPQQNTVLHVVVGIGEGGLHNRFFDGGSGIHLDTGNQNVATVIGLVLSLQNREQCIVHKIHQGIACHGVAGAVIHSPIAPAAFLRDDGHIVFLRPLPVGFLGIVYFQKQHPCNLLNPLGIAVDARVIAHNVPQPLHKSG